MSAPARRDLALIGAGGFGREAVEVVRAIERNSPAWNLLGFLDDGEAVQGTRISGIPVLGPACEAVGRERLAVVVCTGSPVNYSSRRRIVERLGLDHRRYATLVHPTAVVPTSLTLGRGCVLQAAVVATTDVTIGDHVLVMPGAVFTHDDVIGDFVTVGAGVSLAGGVHVGAGAYIGAGALVREERTIGAGSLIGMGSVVLDDVPPGEVWCGNPARRLREAAPVGAGELAVNGRGRNPQ